MNKRCSGCGVLLQSHKPELNGYVEPNMYDKSNFCRRCFRLKFYGDYIFVNKDKEEYNDFLKGINQTGDLVIYMVDILDISNELIYVDKLLNNPLIIVLTKRDLLPKSVKEEKIINYLKKLNLDVIDIICISSEKNYNLDKLYKLMIKHQKSNKVYVVGNSNTGKSSFINKMIKKYSSNKALITTSILPTTTLDLMDIEINDKLNIIDTPGWVEEGSIINYYDLMMLKKITPSKEIKPRIYQVEVNDAIVIENLAQVDYIDGLKNSFILYLSNNLDVIKSNLENGIKVFNHKVHSLEIIGNEDIVISGLGWIKVMGPAKVDVIVNNKVRVYKRDSII